MGSVIIMMSTEKMSLMATREGVHILKTRMPVACVPTTALSASRYQYWDAVGQIPPGSRQKGRLPLDLLWTELQTLLKTLPSLAVGKIILSSQCEWACSADIFIKPFINIDPITKCLVTFALLLVIPLQTFVMLRLELI